MSLMNIIIEITKDVFRNVIYIVENNLRNFATLLDVLLPYAMYFFGQYTYMQRNQVTVGSELLLPIIVCIVIYYIRSYANKIGKGTSIPIPDKRFTQVDDGEVYINNDRIHELLLYTADLEDYLERKGLL